MLQDPAYTKAMLAEQERRVRHLRRHGELHRIEAQAQVATTRRRLWPIRLRDPLRA